MAQMKTRSKKRHVLAEGYFWISSEIASDICGLVSKDRIFGKALNHKFPWKGDPKVRLVLERVK